MNAAELTDLWKLISTHQWVLVASVVIGLLVRLVKDDPAVSWIPFTLAPKYRPGVALGLGIVSAVLHSVATGVAFSTALIEGLSAAMLAITSHDVVIEGGRGGRELLEKKEDFIKRSSPPPAPEVPVTVTIPDNPDPPANL